MTAYLLDTNIVSEVRKAAPDPAVDRWYRSLATSELFISVLTIGEIRAGIVRLERRDPQQANRLRDWLDGLERSYSARILPVTTAVAHRWAELDRVRTIPTVDGLIAATAIAHGAVLVTRNVSDFAGLDVRLHNPFD